MTNIFSSGEALLASIEVKLTELPKLAKAIASEQKIPDPSLAEQSGAVRAHTISSN